MNPRPVRFVDVANAFRSYYRKKTPQDQARVDEALQLMERDIFHRLLRTRKMAGTKTIWEARASDAIRITFEFVTGQDVRLHKCCSHDQAYRRS